MHDEYPLQTGRVEVEPRRGYLHIALHGELPDEAAVEHVGGLLERVMERAGSRRLLFDARGLTHELSQPACDVVWAWLTARAYVQMAVVLPEPLGTMGITRFNMTSLSSSLPVKAFPTVIDAHRWLDMRNSGERRLSWTNLKVAPSDSLAPPNVALSSTPPPSDGKKRSGSFTTTFEPLPHADGTDGKTD